jgi:RES domain-containing protein
VTEASGWNVRTALSTIQPKPWQGHAWRMHFRTYAATDHGGSLRASGRYHRASAQTPRDPAWPALYLALSPEVALGEILRQIAPELVPRINDYRISELAVEVSVVLDCRDASALGLTVDDLTRDDDYEITQEIAAEAISRGADGILVPSATQMGDNLVLFPNQLTATCRLTVIGSRDPRLYVPR